MLANRRTNVYFFNNHAEKGGAIYVQQQCMDTDPPCFLQPNVPAHMPMFDVIKDIKFIFRNNSASIAGDVLYNGNIDQCLTVEVYPWNATGHDKDYRYNKEIFREIFQYQNPHRPSLISSDPSGVCFCYEFQHYNHNETCIGSTDPLAKYPGEIITVSVITVGQRNGSTSGIITANLSNENESHKLVKLNNPGFNATCINLTFAVKSNREIAYINFKPIISELSSIYGNIYPNLTVHLLYI